MLARGGRALGDLVRNDRHLERVVGEELKRLRLRQLQPV